MPVKRYDPYFGGKSGSAQETLANMLKEYGPKKGRAIFYATLQRRKHGSVRQNKGR